MKTDGLNAPFKNILSISLESVYFDDVPNLGSVITLDNKGRLINSQFSKPSSSQTLLKLNSSEEIPDADDLPYSVISYGDTANTVNLPYNDHNYVGSFINKNLENYDKKALEYSTIQTNQYANRSRLPSTNLRISHFNINPLSKNDFGHQKTDNVFINEKVKMDNQLTFNYGTINTLTPSVGNKSINCHQEQLGQRHQFQIHSNSIFPKKQVLPGTIVINSNNINKLKGMNIIQLQRSNFDISNPSRSNATNEPKIISVSTLKKPNLSNVIVANDQITVTKDGDIISNVTSSTGVKTSEVMNVPGSDKSDKAINLIPRCICGFVHDDGGMIRCEICQTWQHIICMYPDNKFPIFYKCERCEPRPIDSQRAIETQSNYLIKAGHNLSDFSVNQDYACHQTETNVGENRSRPKSHIASQFMIVQQERKTYRHLSNSIQGTPSKIYITNHKDQISMPPGSPRTSKRKQDLISLKSVLTKPNSANLESFAVNNYFIQSLAKKDAVEQRKPLVIDHSINGNCPSNYIIAQSTVNSSQRFIDPYCNNDSSGLQLHQQPLQKLSHLSPVVGVLHEPHVQSLTYVKNEMSATLRSILYNQVQLPHHNLSAQQEQYLILNNFSINFASNCELIRIKFNQHAIRSVTELSNNKIIMEFCGIISLSEEYNKEYDFRKQYNPFVLFYEKLEHLSLCIDATETNSESKYIRRSCTPNAEVKHKVIKNGRIHFYIVPINRIPKDVEITIAFDFNYMNCRYPVECACNQQLCELNYMKLKENPHVRDFYNHLSYPTDDFNNSKVFEDQENKAVGNVARHHKKRGRGAKLLNQSNRQRQQFTDTKQSSSVVARRNRRGRPPLNRCSGVKKAEIFVKASSDSSSNNCLTEFKEMSETESVAGRIKIENFHPNIALHFNFKNFKRISSSHWSIKARRKLCANISKKSTNEVSKNVSKIGRPLKYSNKKKRKSVVIQKEIDITSDQASSIGEYNEHEKSFDAIRPGGEGENITCSIIAAKSRVSSSNEEDEYEVRNYFQRSHSEDMRQSEIGHEEEGKYWLEEINNKIYKQKMKEAKKIERKNRMERKMARKSEKSSKSKIREKIYKRRNHCNEIQPDLCGDLNSKNVKLSVEIKGDKNINEIDTYNDAKFFEPVELVKEKQVINNNNGVNGKPIKNQRKGGSKGENNKSYIVSYKESNIDDLKNDLILISASLEEDVEESVTDTSVTNVQDYHQGDPHSEALTKSLSSSELDSVFKIENELIKKKLTEQILVFPETTSTISVNITPRITDEQLVEFDNLESAITTTTVQTTTSPLSIMKMESNFGSKYLDEKSISNLKSKYKRSIHNICSSNKNCKSKEERSKDDLLKASREERWINSMWQRILKSENSDRKSKRKQRNSKSDGFLAIDDSQDASEDNPADSNEVFSQKFGDFDSCDDNYFACCDEENKNPDDFTSKIPSSAMNATTGGTITTKTTKRRPNRLKLSATNNIEKSHLHYYHHQREKKSLYCSQSYDITASNDTKPATDSCSVASVMSDENDSRIFNDQQQPFDEKCGLIVYREQHSNPMEKFSRENSAKLFNENFADSHFLSTTPGGSFHPAHAKKRWLSQALMEKILHEDSSNNFQTVSPIPPSTEEMKVVIKSNNETNVGVSCISKKSSSNIEGSALASITKHSFLPPVISSADDQQSNFSCTPQKVAINPKKRLLSQFSMEDNAFRINATDIKDLSDNMFHVKWDSQNVEQEQSKTKLTLSEYRKRRYCDNNSPSTSVCSIPLIKKESTNKNNALVTSEDELQNVFSDDLNIEKSKNFLDNKYQPSSPLVDNFFPNKTSLDTKVNKSLSKEYNKDFFTDGDDIQTQNTDESTNKSKINLSLHMSNQETAVMNLQQAPIAGSQLYLSYLNNLNDLKMPNDLDPRIRSKSLFPNTSHMVKTTIAKTTGFFVDSLSKTTGHQVNDCNDVDHGNEHNCRHYCIHAPPVLASFSSGYVPSRPSSQLANLKSESDEKVISHIERGPRTPSDIENLSLNRNNVVSECLFSAAPPSPVSVDSLESQPSPTSDSFFEFDQKEIKKSSNISNLVMPNDWTNYSTAIGRIAGIQNPDLLQEIEEFEDEYLPLPENLPERSKEEMETLLLTQRRDSQIREWQEVRQLEREKMKLEHQVRSMQRRIQRVNGNNNKNSINRPQNIACNTNKNSEDCGNDFDYENNKAVLVAPTMISGLPTTDEDGGVSSVDEKTMRKFNAQLLNFNDRLMEKINFVKSNNGKEVQPLKHFTNTLIDLPLSYRLDRKQFSADDDVPYDNTPPLNDDNNLTKVMFDPIVTMESSCEKSNFQHSSSELSIGNQQEQNSAEDSRNESHLTLDYIADKSQNNIETTIDSVIISQKVESLPFLAISSGILTSGEDNLINHSSDCLSPALPSLSDHHNHHRHVPNFKTVYPEMTSAFM